MSLYKVKDTSEGTEYTVKEEELYSLAREYAERLNEESDGEGYYQVDDINDVHAVLECVNIYVTSI